MRRDEALQEVQHAGSQTTPESPPDQLSVSIKQSKQRDNLQDDETLIKRDDPQPIAYLALALMRAGILGLISVSLFYYSASAVLAFDSICIY